MMRSHVFIVFSEVSVLIRWQQIAPKVSILSFRGSEVERKAQRIAETFKDAIKDVVHVKWFNSSHIQIMELVFWKLTLFNSLTERSAIWLESICSWEENNNICTLLWANKWNSSSHHVRCFTRPWKTLKARYLKLSQPQIPRVISLQILNTLL